MTILRFDQVGIRTNGFEEPLLEGLDFTLAAGEALTLVGPPGCGKSTALALVTGGAGPTTGAVRVNDVDLAQLSGPQLILHRRAIGYVPQRGGLLSNLTDNITLPLRYHCGADGEQIAAALKRIFRLFEVEDPPLVQASYASPTWRWIANLAKALILDPELLVVDDMGEDNDLIDREDLWRLLWRVRIERGLMVLAATSDPSAARALGERMVGLPGRRSVSFRILRASSLSLNPYTPSGQ